VYDANTWKVSGVVLLIIHICSWELGCRRLTKGASGSHLMTHVWSRSTATVEGSVTGIIPTHPVNFPCGRKPEYPEKTHDFRQSVDWLFSHESEARIQPTNSDVKGACPDDYVTEGEALLKHNKLRCFAVRLATSRRKPLMKALKCSSLLFLFSIVHRSLQIVLFGNLR
jgi:hypothetical protein